MIPPASAPPVYYSQQQPSQAQPLSSPDPRAFSNLGLKPDRTGGLDAANPSDAMATRSASLVAPPRSREEPEQDQIHSEASKSGTSTKSETAVESKKPEVHVIRKRNVGVPKFLRFLFQILEVEDEDIISWSHQGTAFQIRQPEELADKILPKYFKHNKVSSFQRQLNYFGFKKWTKTQTNICTFSHPFFLQADKDMMKLIKRKERVNTTGFPTIAAVPSLIEAHCQAQAQLKAEAAAFAQLQSQLPQQQAIKRQKSNTMAPMVSGQTAAFLNSAMAGRRHSTGMLPGSEAYGLAAAAAAAAAAASASAAETRKKEGTPAELELGLELEARSDSLAQATTPQQQFFHLQKLAEARDLSMRHPSQSARGKRKSLPHVLPPGFGDTLGSGVNINMSANSNFNPGGAMNLGRRRSEQLLNNFVSGSSSDSRVPLMGQFVRILSPSTSSSSQQVVFANASPKNEPSPVLPMSTNPIGSYHQHQSQQMNRQLNMYGRGPGFGTVDTIKAESRSGWPPSVNASPPSSHLPFQQQANQLMSILPFKFGDSSAAQNNMLSFEGGVSIADYSNGASGAEPKQQRSLFSHLQQQEPHSYQEQSNQQEQPRDYLDVLLESAALDDVQSSSVLPSGSWGDSSYAQQGSSTSGPVGPYPLMQHQQMQMSSPGGIPHYPNQRF